MHYSSMDLWNWGKKAILVGLSEDKKRSLRSANFGDSPISMYEAVF